LQIEDLWSRRRRINLKKGAGVNKGVRADFETLKKLWIWFLAQKRGAVFKNFEKFPKFSKILPSFWDFWGTFHNIFGAQKSGKTIREFTLLLTTETLRRKNSF
jgi:hypothetical protein